MKRFKFFQIELALIALVLLKGLCGLSGIAHGLMVISALELMSEREDRTLFWMGLACFGMVVLKSAFEAFSGRMLFTFLDFGMVGDPVAVTHAGGALGGLLCWVVISGSFRRILSPDSGKDEDAVKAWPDRWVRRGKRSAVGGCSPTV